MRVLVVIVLAGLLVGCRPAPVPTAVPRTPLSVPDQPIQTPAPAITTTPVLFVPSSNGVGPYLDWVRATTKQVDDAGATIADLNVAPVRDDAWKASVAKAADEWTHAYQEAKDKQAPPLLATSHAAFVQALGQYNAAATVVEDGAKAGDDKAVSRGVGQALQGAEALSGAMTQIRAALDTTAPTTATATAEPSTVPAPTLTPIVVRPVVASGSASLSKGFVALARVDNPTPKDNSTVTIVGKLVDARGKGVPGAAMHATWTNKTIDANCDGGPTGSDGSATCTHAVTQTSPGSVVWVDVVFSVNGQTYSTATSFSPL